MQSSQERLYRVRGLEMASDDAAVTEAPADAEAETLIEGIAAPRLLGERRFDYLAGALTAAQLAQELEAPAGFTFMLWLRPERGALWTRIEDLAAAPSQDDLMLIVDDATDNRPGFHACIGGRPGVCQGEVTRACTDIKDRRLP